ncbi:hypothetical protein [Mesorhizobium sp.]|uniref:hypothetical protein n=1 Tax=Mesorhizobium sp. TaxID=1871066 RepID=UPI00120528F8|nr:hypothetical protein [Mesorhizobium sp.]TIL33939.1 MAG: hypothetical protein E5Y85_12185 [Mesorhizobium sp.]
MLDMKVGIELKAVPDGFFGGTKGLKDEVVVSFVLMPTPLQKAGGSGISLASWPQRISELTKFMQVRADGAKIDSVQIDQPNVDSTVNTLWAAALGLSDLFGDEDGKALDAFLPRDSPPSAALGGEGNLSVPLYTAPAAEIAKTLTLISGCLRYLQVKRFSEANESQKKATRSLNPMSPTALQTIVTASMFGLGGEMTIRNFAKAQNIRTTGDMSVAIDALRRIAWTGRQTPPPRIAFLAKDKKVNAGTLADGSPRMSPHELVDEVSMSTNLATGLQHEIRIAREVHELVTRAVDLARNYKTRLWDKSKDNKLDIKQQYNVLSDLFSNIMRGTPPISSYVDAIPGFEKLFRSYQTVASIVMDRINEAVLSGENNIYGHSGAFLSKPQDPSKGFRGEKDPIAALASYEISMMPDRSAFHQTLATLGIESSAWAKDKARVAGIEPEPSPSIIRRLTGLLAYPDVARLFGLIIDVKVKRSLLPKSAPGGEEEFVIEGSFEPGPEISIPPPRPEQVVIPTVCRLNDTMFEPQSLFARSKGLGIPAELRDGHLQLGSGGFEFLTVDVNAALEGSTRAARNDQISRENGEFSTALESGLTTYRTAGLALIDRNIVLKAKLEQAMAKLREPVEDDAPFRDALFLEDLVAGYRIDVGTRDAASTVWRCLTNRTVEFPQIAAGKLNAASSHGASRERMNGYVRSVHREYDSGNEDATDPQSQPKPVAAIYETVTTWRNWSLAVPAGAQERPICQDDLRLETSISLPVSKNPQMKLPRLRFGADYTFGARYVLINGSSLSFEEAVSKNYLKTWPLEKSDVILPGYRFRRHEPVAAPNIFHLPGSGKPVENSEEFDEYKEGLGTIVVGTDSGGSSTSATRLLLAGSQSFELCELHGMLDGRAKLPANSFTGLKTEPPVQPPSANSNEEFYSEQPRKLAPYYVDPLAELMVIGFFKEGELALAPEYPEPVVVDLLAGGRKWPDVRPVLLKVERVQSAGPHSGSSQRAALRVDGADKDSVITVVAQIEPAEMIELRAWCIPRRMDGIDQLAGFEGLVAAAPLVETFVANLSGGPAADALAKLASSQSSKSRIALFVDQVRSDKNFGSLETTLAAERLFVSIPVHGLSHSTTMELIHAVEKPLLAPDVINLWAVHEQSPGMSPAKAANSEPADGQRNEAVLQGWRDFIARYNLTGNTKFEGPLKQLLRSGVEGSQRVLFGGAIAFHRRSTSTLELVGSWLDYTKNIAPRRRGTDAAFSFEPEPKSFKLEPRKQLENIPYEIEGEIPHGQFDLVFDAFFKPRLLFHEFDGTHAKRIDFSAAAISRFAKHFKNRLGRPSDVRTESEQIWTLTIPSTRRPDEVNIVSVSTALHEGGGRVLDIRDSTVGRTLLPLARKIAIRLDLGSSWYSSGVGEMLAVVLWPPNLFDAPSAHAKALRHIGALPKFATCWGRDPIRMTGDLPRLLPASAIVNCKSYTHARVPVPPEEAGPNRPRQIERDDAEPLAFVDCVLAVFEPTVDPDTGHFYVDVEIDPGNSYNAFVHLGLVRYQPDSLLFGDYDLTASLPVESQVTVMPERKLSARIGEHGVILNYSGAGYGAMNAGLLKSHKAPKPEREQLLARLDKLNTSTVDVVVLWRSRDREHSGVPVALRPVYAAEGRKIAELIDMLPTEASPGFMLSWEFQIDFTPPGEACPACRERKQIVVETPDEAGNFQIVIREYEHYLADENNSQETRSLTESLPAPEKYNSRLIKRVVSSFSVDLERESEAPRPDEGDELGGK